MSFVEMRSRPSCLPPIMAARAHEIIDWSRLERGDKPRIGFRQRATPATGAANLPLRQRFGAEIILAAIDSRAGEPSDLGDDRETTPTSGPYLNRCKQPPPPFIQLRAHSLPALPNRVYVDHATDLRWFAIHRNPHDLSHSVAGPEIAIQLLCEVS